MQHHQVSRPAGDYTTYDVEQIHCEYEDNTTTSFLNPITLAAAIKVCSSCAPGAQLDQVFDLALCLMAACLAGISPGKITV